MSNSTTLPVIAVPAGVPEGFVLPDIPEGMFMAKAYPADADEQQHVLMRTPDGALVLYNGDPRFNIWTIFAWMDAGAFQYVAPFQHENGGGGNTSLPFSLVWNDDHTKVIDIMVVLWGRPRKTILDDNGQPDLSWLEVKGGFSNQGEARKAGADRELSEESSGVKPGEHFETSVARTAINRATSVLLDSDEGVANFAFEMTDAKLAEFEANPDDRIMSIWEVTVSRDSLAKAAAFDLLAWVRRNYPTAF